MSDENKKAETAVSGLIGHAFSGTSAAVVEDHDEAIDPTGSLAFDSHEPFDLDEEFQTKIVYLAVTDTTFMRKVSHLLRPEYFEKVGEQSMVKLALDHFQKYKSALTDIPTLKVAIQDAKDRKVLRGDQLKELAPVISQIHEWLQEARAGKPVGVNADYVADKVAQFARNAAVTNAILQSAELLNKGDFEKIEKLVTKATKVGIQEAAAGGDYFERLQARTDTRADKSVGKLPPRGITTGERPIDELLYHRGWGRKELTVLMGGAKAGKTTALIHFALGAVMATKNVLYVTLEVASEIVEDRADARITETEMTELVNQFGVVRDKVSGLESRVGRFYIAEYPSGSFSPSMLRGLLERHKAEGKTYDMVVVDYADIMRPDFRTTDPIENLRTIYVDLRAIATEWDVALLTATQSNREGYKAIVAKAEHVSDDFNKVRTADLFITINSTEEERKRGEARLYFAASRNQRSGFTIFIRQDFGKMQFISRIERIE